MEVDFFNNLLTAMGSKTKVFHGGLSENQRSSNLNNFITAPNGALLCTDIAARGLYIDGVHWVIQYDPPDDVKTYIHRVGRSARAGNRGKATILLRNSERGFVDVLKGSKVNIKETPISKYKVTELDATLKEVMSSDRFQSLAKEAFSAYLTFYHQNSMKNVFNPNNINTEELAQSFGLMEGTKISFVVRSGKTADGQWIKKEKKKKGK